MHDLHHDVVEMFSALEGCFDWHAFAQFHMVRDPERRAEREACYQPRVRTGRYGAKKMKMLKDPAFRAKTLAQQKATRDRKKSMQWTRSA